MNQAELFSQPKPRSPYAEISERLWQLAKRKIYFGSSSWKYESWRGPVYAREYKSKKDFEQNCLEEYSELFPAVGGDFSFYNWPSSEMISRIDSQTPVGFKIGLKCTEFITLKRFPLIARWGEKAGAENPDFLNAKLFKEKFLNQVAPLGPKLAPLILEFTAFPRGSFTDWTEFAQKLEGFFDEVRRLGTAGFEFGIEVRSREYFHEDFWAALKAMGAAPILNSWTRTPPLDEQWKGFAKHDFAFVEARPVMRPGRTHDEAVLLFKPYDKLRETVLPARSAMIEMARWALQQGRPCYIFVNNHLEGCAFETIAAVTEELTLT